MGDRLGSILNRLEFGPEQNFKGAFDEIIEEGLKDQFLERCQVLHHTVPTHVKIKWAQLVGDAEVMKWSVFCSESPRDLVAWALEIGDEIEVLDGLCSRMYKDTLCFNGDCMDCICEVVSLLEARGFSRTKSAW